VKGQHSPFLPTRTGLAGDWLHLFQVEPNQLRQHRYEPGVMIRQRGTSESQVLRCGKSAGLNIQIVEHLQVIGKWE
jgi:hypothetical protein